MVALSTLRPGFLGRISMSWGSTQTAARLSNSRGGASSGELSSIEPASFVQPVSPYKRYVKLGGPERLKTSWRTRLASLGG